MRTTEANIEITRKGETLSSVSVIMPVWSKQDCDNTIIINIPLFGLKTVAKDDEDANTAIEEAIKCFCLAAEKFGQGIEKELQTIGWTPAKSAEHNLLDYSVGENDYVLEQLLETGEQYANADLELEYA